MRARNIKPGFFKNEELAEIEPLGRLLFSGLWCMADREGKLEDRPKRIKAEVLPYDDFDVNNLLDELQERKFILRYAVDGGNYIKILKFSEHQRPHNNEAVSIIPEPLSTMVESTSNHGEKPLQPTPQALRSDSLIPRTLIPDSLIPESSTPQTPRKRGAAKPEKTFLPQDFTITPALQTWATEHGFTNLQDHLEYFRDWAISNGKEYADWDAVFRNAIRGNWAKINGNSPVKINYCTKHPTVKARLSMEGVWYCQACLDEIDRIRPSPDDVKRMKAILGTVTNKLASQGS